MNSIAGEKELEILGEKYICRPDFAALMAIESHLNCSLVEIFDRFANRAPRLTDLAVIVFYTHKSFNPNTKETFNSFGEKIRSQGVSKLSFDIFMIISDVLSGDEKKKDETIPEDKSVPLSQ